MDEKIIEKIHECPDSEGRLFSFSPKFSQKASTPSFQRQPEFKKIRHFSIPDRVSLARNDNFSLRLSSSGGPPPDDGPNFFQVFRSIDFLRIELGLHNPDFMTLFEDP